jgi:predicted transcriptional regulator
MTKLTAAQAKEIRRRYLAKEKNQPALAREYGVNQVTISRIVHGYVPKSRYRELDTIDHQILNCIEECEGLSMVEIYRCYNLEADKNLSEQLIRYRINSLEEKGHIRTIRIKGKPAKRACFHRVNQDL